MKTNKHSKLITLQLVILLACLLPCFVSKINLSNGILYFIFQLLVIFIPGYAVSLLINRNRQIEIISYSYAYGIAALILQYWLLQLLNISNFSLIVNIIICTISIIYLYKNRFIEYHSFEGSYFLYILLFCLFIICFLTVSCANPLPTYNGGTNYNKDFLFWIGNSISFIKGIPVQTFTLVGNNYYYHYFSSIAMAQISICTGINIYSLSYYFSYIIPCILLVFSSFNLLNKTIKNRIYIYLGIILILFTEGSTTYLTSHLYFCPFGFDYSYAFGMLAVSSLYDIYKGDESIFTFLESCLFIIATTGMKGPTAVVILMAFAFQTLFMLFDKQYGKGFLYGSGWLISFLLVYLLCITNIFSNETRTNNLEFVGLLGGFDNNIWAIKNLNYLINSLSFPNNGLTRIIALALYILRSNFPAIMLLFIYFVLEINNFVKRKNINKFNICLFATCIWGIVLTIITHQDGNSQMYFIMSAFPYCVLLGLQSIDKKSIEKKKICFIVILILCLSFTNIKRFVCGRVIPEVKYGISVVNGNPDTSNYRYFFTENDYEVAVWLKNNTDSNDYIALDCFEYDGLRKELGFGVLSERFIWNDGQYANEQEKNRRREIVNDLFNGDLNSLNNLKKENVKYLIQTITINPIFELSDNLETVFENDSYIVYKLY